MRPIEHLDTAELLHKLHASVSVEGWLQTLAAVGGLRALIMSPSAAGKHVSAEAVEAVSAALELSARVHRARDERPRLGSPAAIAEYLRPQLGHLTHERVLVLSLNSRHRLLSMDVVADGTVDQCIVDPRAVFAAVLPHQPSSIVLAHNHPSGDPEPSLLDVNLTRTLASGARELGITLADHIIIAGDSHASFLQKGLLRAARSYGDAA